MAGKISEKLSKWQVMPKWQAWQHKMAGFCSVGGTDLVQINRHLIYLEFYILGSPDWRALLTAFSLLLGVLLVVI